MSSLKGFGKPSEKKKKKELVSLQFEKEINKALGKDWCAHFRFNVFTSNAYDPRQTNIAVLAPNSRRGDFTPDVIAKIKEIAVKQRIAGVTLATRNGLYEEITGGAA